MGEKNPKKQNNNSNKKWKAGSTSQDPLQPWSLDINFFVYVMPVPHQRSSRRKETWSVWVIAASLRPTKVPYQRETTINIWGIDDL